MCSNKDSRDATKTQPRQRKEEKHFKNKLKNKDPLLTSRLQEEKSHQNIKKIPDLSRVTHEQKAES